MRENLHITLIAPDRKLYEGEAITVSLPGAKAGFSVLTGHAPLVSLLEPGVVEVQNNEGKKTYIIDSGFAEVKQNNVTILVDGAILPEEIDLEKEQSELEENIKLITTSEDERSAKEMRIQKNRVRIRFASNKS
ncbi:MAG: ATP synthase F1 subunit epsilon [Spirochaetia bacterium]|nr:ATP synthase F1 subunit epsilon [Spirochaetia bacterium]